MRHDATPKALRTHSGPGGAGVGVRRPFFEEHSLKVFGAMCVVSGNRQEAEEITQDAFLRIWERWDRVSKLEDLVGFLFRTAMNVFRDRARRATLAARRTLGLADRTDDLAAVEGRNELVSAMVASRLINERRSWRTSTSTTRRPRDS
jgi:RNA polymerase sigma-70 factor (ECF subfamily)